MARLEVFKGKITLLLVVGILILIASFIVIGCGTDPQFKIQNPVKGQCAVDFSLDSTNQAVLTSGNASYPSIAGDNLTVEAWVKPGAPSSTAAQGIFGRYGDAGAILYVQGGKAKFALRQVTPVPPATSTSTDYTVSGTTIMGEDTWYHIAGVVANEGHTHDVTATCTTTVMAETPHLDMYVNGEFEDCATTWDSISFSGEQGVSNPSTFGNNNSATNVSYIGFLPKDIALVGGNSISSVSQFQGAIDEVRLWTVSRSADDIANCRTAELTESGACALNPDILKGYWKMNECEGTDVLDWSGSGSAGGIEIGVDPWADGWVNGAF